MSSSNSDPVLDTHPEQSLLERLNPAPFILEQTALIQKDLSPDSHDLAESTPIISGAIQSQQDGERSDAARDIGWHKPNNEIPDPLIGGIPNGKLFSIIRRFNKDVFAVKRAPPQIARGLDLNETWSEEYANDKLPLHLQRFYLSFVLGITSFANQVSRLRSWKETSRTSAFCAVYTLAWFVDMLMPLILGTTILIVASEDVRNTLFPPAPRALVSTATGGIQKPPSGQLGTTDTLTGAPEKQKGEGVEEEAAGFVDNIRHLAQKIVGMHEEQKHEGDPLEGKIPKPIRKAAKGIKAKGTGSGHAEDDGGQTEKPMEDVLWTKANPETLAPVIKAAPHVIGEIVDNWERFANAINPTPPFSRLSFIRIDGVLLPLFLGSFFVSNYMVYKGTGLAVGFAVFGDPFLAPALQWLNHAYPKWVELLEPKNNILRGVPTNSQLALTLLRIGEAHGTPIPPVPTSNPNDQDHPLSQQISVEEIPLAASSEDKIDAVNPSPETREGVQGEPSGQEEKHKHLSRFTRIFKGNTKAAVETKLATDRVRAAAGSKKAKDHLGVLPKEKSLVYAGPSDFKARHEGKNGWLCITGRSNPALLFTTHDPRSTSSHADLDPLLTIEIDKIRELKRATAFVSKPGEAAAKWSNDRELLGSLEIEDMDGTNWRFTALPERDELFNRLIAIGNQRWENL